MKKLFLTFAGFALAAFPAFASPDSESHVRAFIEQMHQGAEGHESNFIVDEVDMPRVSKFVLGKYGRDASAEDLALFASRLDTFMRNFLSSRSDELSNANVEVLSSVDRNATDSIVTTRVSSPTREPMIMRWRVLMRDGEWRLVDVEVHGLWLAIEQRAQVASLLDKNGANIRDVYPSESPAPGAAE
jgi:phospholipid transport system substrate-binding protein